jgi:mannose-6-phosphate isomerase
MLSLRPSLKDAIWGGFRLFERYRKGSGERLAESWELSTHADGHSRLSDGRTLQDRLAREPWLAGGSAHQDGTIPILAKLIDARLPLSVQVHPDDDGARRHGELSGKTECWYILDADPDAWIYHGLRKSLTRMELEQHVREGTIESVLRKVPVHAGDVFFIPAGTLHALGGGILCFELQQSSNVTYRVFDYDRRDHAGMPRMLHLQEALDVATLTPTPREIPGLGQPRTIKGLTRRMIVCCDQFAMEELTLNGEGVVDVPRRQFAGLFIVEGQCRAVSCRPQSRQMGDDELLLTSGQTAFLASQESILLRGKVRAFLFSPSN